MTRSSGWAGVLLGALVVVGCGGSSPHPPPASGGGSQASPVTSLHADVSVRPARAGTPARPQPVTLALTLRVGAPRDVEPPQVTTAQVDLPAGNAYDGRALPGCDLLRLRRGGPGACPRASITGHGTAQVDADTSKSTGQITVLNGGPDRLLLWVSLRNPARVEDAVVGTFGGAHLSLAFPKSLQEVAGVPLILRELRITAGSRRPWLFSTGCPGSGRWSYRAAVQLSDGRRLTRTATAPCR